jgi:peptide-methionine (R)-S-oxide reductase
MTIAGTRGAWANSQASSAGVVSIENFSPDGKSLGVVQEPKVHKTEEEWRKQLPPDSYVVTRQAGTERAFSGPLWNQHGDGLYHCICCDSVLYDSQTKFESGTGWPSFTRPLVPENVTTKTDRTLGMSRTEVRSAHADSHLGHLFDDGPRPTGMRYCMNSASMRFIPASKLVEEGYGEYAHLFTKK